MHPTVRFGVWVGRGSQNTRENTVGKVFASQRRVTFRRSQVGVGFGLKEIAANVTTRDARLYTPAGPATTVCLVRWCRGARTLAPWVRFLRRRLAATNRVYVRI